MAYVFGYFVADGCISISKNRKRPFTFNITSIDKAHLKNIKNALGSNYKISEKSSGNGNPAFQLQIRNEVIAKDLINLGVTPRKTYNLNSVKVPDQYFSDFVRGFFDGDGTVYIHNVNKVPQIKVGFVSVAFSFLEDFNQNLCRALNIPAKNIHIDNKKDAMRMQSYSIVFYIDDCEKFYKFIYGDDPTLFLPRKKKVFERWKNKSINRRSYIKKNYPSKIGWHLNQKVSTSN